MIGGSPVASITVAGVGSSSIASVVLPGYIGARGRMIVEWEVKRKIIVRKNQMDRTITIKSFSKTSGEALDYDFDFTEFLGADDTISSAEITISPATGIIQGSLALYAKIVKQWISSGDIGQIYSVSCKITTALGRIKRGEMLLTISGA